MDECQGTVSQNQHMSGFVVQLLICCIFTTDWNRSICLMVVMEYVL